MFSALSALVAEEVKRAVGKRVTFAALMLLASIFFLFGFGFCLVGLRDWIETEYMTPYATVIVAGALLIIGGVIVAIAIIRNNKRVSSTILPSAALVLAPSAVRLAGRSLTPRLIAMGTIVVAGIWLGRRVKNS